MQAFRGGATPLPTAPWATLPAGKLPAGANLWGNLIAFKLLVIGAYGVGTILSYGIKDNQARVGFAWYVVFRVEPTRAI